MSDNDAKRKIVITFLIITSLSISCPSFSHRFDPTAFAMKKKNNNKKTLKKGISRNDRLECRVIR